MQGNKPARAMRAGFFSLAIKELLKQPDRWTIPLFWETGMMWHHRHGDGSSTDCGTRLRAACAAFFLFASAWCSAATPEIVLPFQLTVPHTYQAYLIKSFRGDCKSRTRDAGNRYAIAVTPQQGYANVFIKKETDSYTRKALISIEDVANTNALDFATFRLYPDGHVEFHDAQANLRAFRLEKQEVERALESEPSLLGRAIALDVAKDRFEANLEKEIWHRYGVLFDIGHFRNLRSTEQGAFDPAVYSYFTLPFLAYKASYSVTRNDALEITTLLQKTAALPGGRCDPAVLKNLDKSSLFFNDEHAMCRASMATTTTYRYAESGQMLTAVDRVETRDGDVDNPYAICTALEIR